MSSPYKVKQSRQQWQQKATSRADDNRYLRKALQRVKRERDAYKKRAKQTEAELSAQRLALPDRLRKVDWVQISLPLFVDARHLKPSVLAGLAPPKTSTKGRFMHLHRLVKWADRRLHHAAPGRTRARSAFAKLRAALAQLAACKSFITLFRRGAEAQRVLEISVAQQQEVIGSVSSLTKQRRYVLPNPGSLESRFEADRHHHVELLGGSKNRSKSAVISTLSNGYELLQGAPLEVDDEVTMPLNNVLSVTSMAR
ncbi:MAG: hypothetical protein O7G88_16500 [bacterium]|nr:hypothetical protein [bacterium]